MQFILNFNDNLKSVQTMKSNIPNPDVVIRGGALLDNGVHTFETSGEQSDDRTAFFTQRINVIPPNADLIHSATISSQDASWGEVSGNWLNHPNSSNGSSVGNNSTNHAQSFWYDGDQMDVPLLNSVSVFVSRLYAHCYFLLIAYDIAGRRQLWSRNGSLGPLPSKIDSVE